MRPLYFESVLVGWLPSFLLWDGSLLGGSFPPPGGYSLARDFFGKRSSSERARPKPRVNPAVVTVTVMMICGSQGVVHTDGVVSWRPYPSVYWAAEHGGRSAPRRARPVDLSKRN